MSDWDDAVGLHSFSYLIAFVAARIRKRNPHISFRDLFLAGFGNRITPEGNRPPGTFFR
jgi:hypothetical protein